MQERKRQEEKKRAEEERLAAERERAMMIAAFPGEEEEPSKGPKPIPPKVQMFLAGLSKDDKEHCKYDEKRGALVFESTKRGAELLNDFLEKNPEAKFKIEGLTKDNAKEKLDLLKDAGIDIRKKLTSLTMDGMTYSGTELQKQLDRFYPPGPKPT